MADKQENYGVESFPKPWLTRFDENTLERLAIMTVDGGLSDEEAVRRLEFEH